MNFLWIRVPTKSKPQVPLDGVSCFKYSKITRSKIWLDVVILFSIIERAESYKIHEKENLKSDLLQGAFKKVIIQ